MGSRDHQQRAHAFSPDFYFPDIFGSDPSATYPPPPDPPRSQHAVPVSPSPSPRLPRPQTRDENGVPFYTSTGFDMLAVLAQVVSRPAPQIDLGAVDLSCAFCVVDVRERGQPIVYASPMFMLLTGYAESEVSGKNCRFLQSPDGQVKEGDERKWTGGREVYAMKHHLRKGREIQVKLINYRKGGRRFLNLVTVVPVPDPVSKENDAFFVGFQVDLSEGPSAAMSKLRDGSYLTDYHTMGLPPALLGRWDTYTTSRDLPALLGTGSDNAATQAKISALLLEHNSDFIHVLSLKGDFLYVSPSIMRALGHDASALIGTSLMSLTHPADCVPLERDLKDACTDQAGTVRLLYRMRTGPAYPAQCAGAGSATVPEYVWIESVGHLHLERGKGRKAMIMCARRVRVPPRPNGGIGGLHAWAVLDAAGTVLAAAPESALPRPGALFADAACPPDQGLLRRFIAHGARALAVRMKPEYGGGRKKIVLSVREGRVLAEVRDEGPHSPVSDAAVLDEISEEYAQSWQFALNHLRKQNATLRELVRSAQQGTGWTNPEPVPSTSLGKRAYD